MLLRPCNDDELLAVLAIINDGAGAYRGVIPPDRLPEPYMSAAELRHEIDAGVRFFAADEAGALMGVMGVQTVQDVTLIRHAYVRTTSQGKGVGSALLRSLLHANVRPVLIGAWADAIWAIRFYEKHGFRLVNAETRRALLQRYWTVPERQIETSVVLADERWWRSHGSGH